VVRSPGLEQQLFGGLKKIVGGNIESFAKVCETARSEAFSRMMEQAKTMNADAIIAMRYDATEFAPGISQRRWWEWMPQHDSRPGARAVGEAGI
jgi:uncharacterized protein YbjQ (UPF0145 family)